MCPWLSSDESNQQYLEVEVTSQTHIGRPLLRGSPGAETGFSPQHTMSCKRKLHSILLGNGASDFMGKWSVDQCVQETWTLFRLRPPRHGG